MPLKTSEPLPIKILASFDKGHITRMPAESVPEGAFPDEQNISLDEKFVPTVALGQFKYNLSALASAPVRGGCIYATTDGTKYYVAACGGFLWYSISGSGTYAKYQISSADLTMNAAVDVEFAQYNNNLYVVNGQYPVITNAAHTTDRMLKISGTTVTGLTVSDIPENLQYIWIHQERMFGAGSTAAPNGLYWTNAFFDYASNSETNWTPTAGLNYDYVGKDDGENISGLYSYQGYALVFKAKNLYRYATSGDLLSGGWGSTRVDTTYGTAFNRTIQELEGYLYWLSGDGVVMFDGNNATIIDDQIRPDILALPQLKTNSSTWLLSQTSDYNAGTFGTTLIDTSDATIQQLPQSTQTDWQAGTATQVDVTTSPGDVILAQAYSVASPNDYAVGKQINNAAGIAGCSSEIFLLDDVKISNFSLYYDPGVGHYYGRVAVYSSEDAVTWTTLWPLTYLTTPTAFNLYLGYSPSFINAKYLKMEYTLSGAPAPTNITWNIHLALPGYYPSGNIVSQTLDYGLIPTTGQYGHFVADYTVPTGTSMTFTTESSADGTTWTTPADAIVSGGAITTTVQRYLRWTAYMTSSSDYTLTPTLSAVRVGGVWQSAAKDLGTTPASWGMFESSYFLNSQTITFFMRSAASSGALSSASWVQQTPGTTITGVTLAQWVQIQVVLDTTNDQMPAIYSLGIIYFTGSNLVKPCSYSWKNEYGLNVTEAGQSVNNVVWRYNKRGYWLKRTNKYNNVYFQDEQYLLSGSSLSDGYARINESGYTDDGYAIDAYFTTKNISSGTFVNVFRKYIIASKSDYGWVLSYSIDNGSWVDIFIQPSANTTTLFRSFPGLNSGNFIQLKFRTPTETDIIQSLFFANPSADYYNGLFLNPVKNSLAIPYGFYQPVSDRAIRQAFVITNDSFIYQYLYMGNIANVVVADASMNTILTFTEVLGTMVASPAVLLKAGTVYYIAGTVTSESGTQVNISNSYHYSRPQYYNGSTWVNFDPGVDTILTQAGGSTPQPFDANVDFVFTFTGNLVPVNNNTQVNAIGYEYEEGRPLRND